MVASDLALATDAPPQQLDALDAAIGRVHAALPPAAPVQARSRSGLDARVARTAAARGVGDAGGALPFADRIQQSFGRHALTGVRAHVGESATRAAADLGALAFATGDHIAFGRAPDLFTAAHEAAHVVQQRAGVSLRDGVGAPGDTYERHADEVAALVVRGESAEALLDRHAAGASARGGAGASIQRDGDGEAGRSGKVPGGDKAPAGGGKRPKGMAPLGPDIEAKMKAQAAEAFQGEVTASIGADNLPRFSFALGVAWPVDVGCPAVVEDGSVSVYATARDVYPTLRARISALFGGDEGLAEAQRILQARASMGPKWGMNEAMAGDAQPNASRALGLATLDEGYFARTMVASSGSKRSLELFAANPGATLYERDVLRYAAGQGREATSWREALTHIAEVLGAVKTELAGLFQVRLGGKTYYLKTGESVPFLDEKEAALEENAGALYRQYAATRDAMIAQMKVNDQHRFAVWMAGGHELDLSAWDRAWASVSAALVKQREHATFVAGDPRPRVAHLAEAYQALSDAADECSLFESEVELWKELLLSGAEELLAVARRVRDLAFAVLGVLAGNYIQALQLGVMCEIVGAAAVEGVKSVATQMSDKGTLNPLAVDGFKVTEDMASAAFAKGVMHMTKEALNAKNLLGHDVTDEALEGAISETFKLSIGQEMTREQFLYNVAQAATAKAVGG